ncbi:hypothetical protein IWQ62_000867 [Dispira parvispora]|uniref:PDZ GRASP-type domain-containing protein n=1 Tax=Dispira parvispora TaxID=1520584 RepID=A0A9W8E8S6_9FUNG|nr:hypothetical protein IWQ62_000867 [Dispira parvispora]
MGAEQSAENQTPISGFHVLQVYSESPSASAGLVPYFDFIVGVNDQPLNEDSGHFLQQILTRHVGQTVRLLVYSTQSHELRPVHLTPRASWTNDPHQGIAGCVVRFCNPKAVEENVWHVLTVSPDSPAQRAGLRPHSDYVVGTPLAAFHTQSDFTDMVVQSLDKPLPLLVYNVESQSCREVSIVPQRNWGGEGLLGCDIGFGYLHRIPKATSTDAVQQGAGSSPVLLSSTS